MNTGQLLEEFPAYLEAHRLAKPGHVPYLQRWAQRYLDAPTDPALAPDDRLRVFLATLAESPGVADWQVRQAEDAVRLLRQFAREKRSGAGGMPIPPSGISLGGRGSRSTPAYTRCAIALPRICLRQGSASVRSRSCSGMAMSRPRCWNQTGR